MITAHTFASAFGISPQAAREAFRVCSAGGRWRGELLPVREIIGQRGGASGKAWGLQADLCSPAVKEVLILPKTMPATPIEERSKGRAEDRHIAAALDKQRLIAPILDLPRGSAERAKAIHNLASQPAHQIAGQWVRLAERTLYEWVKTAETNVAELIPSARSDRGQRRVRIRRAWDSGCGLAEEVQDRISKRLEDVARGLFCKGRSERNVCKLCSSALQKLTVEAGSVLPKAKLAMVCKINAKWTARFRDMRIVHTFEADNKAFTDKHEHHVKRGLTARPMEVLMGDVHTVDLTISDAISSKFKVLRETAFKVAMAGEVTVKAWIIGWMDGSSGYMWATPVITGPGQGITQQDVALSLNEVLTCPWGGMPGEFIIDNGSEYRFLAESVIRFAAMAELSGLKVVKCAPYTPEGKARIEGAFNVIETGFVSALPGYNGGNILKPRLQGRGKPIAPYDRGPEQLIADIHLAFKQYNGTAQDGDLRGYSLKGMLEAKIEATGWQAQRIDPADEDMFDLVFSREERRDVRQGCVKIGTRAYSGAVLSDLIGEKQVSILVPFRDPDGPVILFRDGVVHRLTHEVFALNDREGAVRKSEMVGLQKAEIARRKAKADMTVDVQQMLSDTADLGPVRHNQPYDWTFGALDKGGFIGAPISEQEARTRHDAEVRADMEEYLSLKQAGKREAGGGDRQASLNAT